MKGLRPIEARRNGGKVVHGMSLLDYAVEERIGSGGFAEVHLARVRAGPLAGSTVVVKRLLSSACDAESVALLLREARLASRLHHPGVVEVLETGQHEGRPYLVLEHVDGPDLARLLARVKARRIELPAAFAAFIVRRAAEALQAAHSARGADGRLLGLVHCDVSPSNILVSRTGEVKVTDFGVARVAGALGRGRALGKVRYLAPEILRGEPVDARTDVFGLGAVLFELLTGRAAFEGDELERLVAEIVGGSRRPPSALRAIPPGFDELTLRALAISPDGRFETADAMARALAAACEGADELAIAALVRAFD